MCSTSHSRAFPVRVNNQSKSAVKKEHRESHRNHQQSSTNCRSPTDVLYKNCRGVRYQLKISAPEASVSTIFFMSLNGLEPWLFYVPNISMSLL